MLQACKLVLSFLALVQTAVSLSTQCSTTTGQCEPLTADRWCGEGNGIGCTNAVVVQRKSSIGCHYVTCGPEFNSYDTTASSVVSNLTVVASPFSTYSTDLHIQWESPADDDSITGYEVSLSGGSGNSRDSYSCACLNRSTRHVILSQVNTQLTNSLKVEVRTLPYTQDTRSDKEVSVVIPITAATRYQNRCFAVAANTEHCSSKMTYYTIPASNVTTYTSYLPNSNELMSATISWPHLPPSGLGVVVALTDPSLPRTSCTSPGRHPPCFIVKGTGSITIEPLNASISYKFNLQGFNTSTCSGFSPTHLLDGCGDERCCRRGNGTLFPPDHPSAPPPPLQGSPTSHDSHVTLAGSEGIAASHESVPETSAPPTLTSAPTMHPDLETLATFPMHPDLETSATPTLHPDLETSVTPTLHPDTPILHNSDPENDPGNRTASLPLTGDSGSRVTAAQESGYLVPLVCVLVVGVVTACILTALILVLFLWRRLSRHKSPARSTPPPSLGLGSKYASTGYSNNLSQQGVCPLLNSTPSPMPFNELCTLPPSGYLPFTQFSQVQPPSDFPLTESHSSATPLSPPTHLTSSRGDLWSSSLSSSTTHSSSRSSPHEPPEGTRARPQHAPTSLPLGTTYPHHFASLSETRPQQPQSLISPLGPHPQPPPPQTPPEDSVLIIYSPSITMSEREVILMHLVRGLTEYGLSSRCHDTACVKSPCQWMEAEVTAACAVLCVCTPHFHREWTQSPSDGKIPVVGLLRHLVHATVSRGESLGKFATVLLRREDSECIPSLYLQGEPRQFLVSELEEIVKFIQNMPSYRTLP